MRALPFAIVLLMLGIPSSAQTQATAAKPDEKPTVNVGATIFTNYTYTAAPESKDADGNAYNPSSFDVTRAYINVTGKVSRFSFRVTPDIVRESGAGSSLAGSLTFRLKYAYGQASLGKSAWVRLGIQQTPYIDYTEGIYRYRFQGPVFADREGYQSSSDTGLSLHYDLPKGYGDVHSGLYNGETYSKAEANDQKSFKTRVSVRPFPASASLKGLRVTGFYDHDAYVRDAERRRLIGQVTYEYTVVTLGGEYVDTRDRTGAAKPAVNGEGWSFWAIPKFGHGVEALLRVDHLEPGNGPERNRAIVGLAYWFPHTGKAALGVLGDYEQVTGPSVTTQQKVFLHAVLNF